jgi:hypothetical protein
MKTKYNMKDPRINIVYDFEGDDEDAEDLERWTRSLHPIEDYPYFDGGDSMDDPADSRK